MPALAGAVRLKVTVRLAPLGSGGVRDTTPGFPNGFGWWTAQRQLSPNAAA